MATLEDRRPTVAEYLETHELSDEELAELVGVQVKTVQARKSERDRQIPASWLERIETGDREIGKRGSRGGEPDGGRAEETAPKPPPGARIVEPEPSPIEGVDFTALAGYIEGAYKLGAAAVAGTDPALSAAVDSHAAQAGQAWAHWVESEPKVAALIQRMMIGTPLGEVIAVHVGIGFAYFLSRSAIERARREERAAAEELDVEHEFADLPGTAL